MIYLTWEILHLPTRTGAEQPVDHTIVADKAPWKWFTGDW